MAIETYYNMYIRTPDYNMYIICVRNGVKLKHPLFEIIDQDGNIIHSHEITEADFAPILNNKEEQ